jgi:hypothetical protein
MSQQINAKGRKRKAGLGGLHLQASDAPSAAAASATATKALTFVGEEEAKSILTGTLDFTECPICMDPIALKKDTRVVAVEDTTHLCDECYESVCDAQRKGEDPLRGFYSGGKGKKPRFTFCDRNSIVISDKKLNSKVPVQGIKCGCGDVFTTTINSAMSVMEHARTCPAKFLQDIRSCGSLADSVRLYNMHSPPREKKRARHTEEQSPSTNIFSPTRLDAPPRPRRPELGRVSRHSFTPRLTSRFPGARPVLSGAADFYPVPPPMLTSAIAHGEEEEEEEVTTDEEEPEPRSYLAQVSDFARISEQQRSAEGVAVGLRRVHSRRHALSDEPPIPSPQ